MMSGHGVLIIPPNGCNYGNNDKNEEFFPWHDVFVKKKNENIKLLKHFYFPYNLKIISHWKFPRGYKITTSHSNQISKELKLN